MILTKIIVSKVMKHLVDQLQLDKIMNYVFEDNDLDKKVKILTRKVRKLEKIAHPQREFVVCNECKQSIEEK